MKKLLILFLLINFNTFSQSVSIGVFNRFYPIEIKVKTIYENIYGVGNVTITNYNNNYNTPLATLLQHDIIMLSVFYDATVPKSFADNLVLFYQNDKHLVLSTEGSELVTGEKLSSYVWNKITGQAITETAGGAYGTPDPPRFHPSNGPGGLSQNINLVKSSTTYASFGNLYYMNVLHQRTRSAPDCKNVEGLDALYPHIPVLGKGTIYINGEIYYPFFINPPEIVDLANNVAILHQTLLTNDQTKLDSLNNWSTDPNLQLNFSLKREDVKFTLPNVISPNNDRVNDEFKTKFQSHNPKKIDLKIFNRWGNLVYTSQDINFNWKGKDLKNNSPLATGVYFYTLIATFENECNQYEDIEYIFDYKGNISIFR
jgi:gliding motility-associated-like protein